MHRSYLLGYCINHRLQHQFMFFIAGICPSYNSRYVGCTQMSQQASSAIQHFTNFLISIFAAEAQIYQLPGRNCTCTFRAERSFPIQCIIYVNHFSVMMRTDRDSSSQMYNYQIKLLVFFANPGCIITRNRPTVQRMENRDTRNLRNTGQPGYITQFVGDYRICNKSRTSCRSSQFICYQSCQIGSVFHISMPQIVLDTLIYPIYPTGSRLQ